MKGSFPVGIFAGRLVKDHLIYLPETPSNFDGKYEYDGRGVYAGGSSSNAARAFAALAGKTLPYEHEASILYSAMGNEADGVQHDLQLSNITIRDCAPYGFNLKQNFIIAAGGTRFVAIDNTPETKHIDDETMSFPEGLYKDLGLDLTRADIVMLDTRAPLVTTAIAQAAREQSVPVVLDAGAWRPYMASLINVSDVVIASHEFKPDGQKASPEDIIGYLRDQGIKKAAVTRGEKPTLMWQDGQADIRAIPSVSYGAAVDTLGAGDIMHGAYCYFHAVSDGDFDWALARATEVASLKVLFRGPQEGLQRIEKVAEYGKTWSPEQIYSPNTAFTCTLR